MNKKITFLIIGFFVLGTITTYSQKGVVNNGAKIVVSKNAVINIGGSNANYTNKKYKNTSGTLDLDGLLFIQGDWKNEGSADSALININSVGEIIFNGSAAQSINGNATMFETLTVNNTAGLNLFANTGVNNALGLTSGVLDLGSNNLTLSSNASILGTPSVSNMVVTSGSGELQKYFSSTGTFVYPVGDNTATAEYSPVTLQFNSGTFGGYAGVRVTNAKHPGNYSISDYINRYWTVTTSGISAYDGVITMKYNDADVTGSEANLLGGKYEGGLWTQLNAANTSTNLLSAAFTSLAADYTAGESNAFTLGAQMSDDGTIIEGNENNEVITVTITGDQFVSSLTTSNWTFANLPVGVAIGSLNRISNTEVQITLSGNRTADYDANITNAELQIAGGEFVSNNATRYISSGITFTANNESAILYATGLDETTLNNATVSVKLENESFADATLAIGNFTLNNAPGGLSVSNVTYEASDSAVLTLAFNGSDFDNTISDFSVTVNKNELLGVADVTTSAVVITAQVEPYSASVAYTGTLTENYLNNAVLNIALTNITFADNNLLPASFTLENAPAGTTVKTVSYTDTAHASITLAFDGTDFSSDISNFTINIAGAEISGNQNISTNALTIYAVNVTAVSTPSQLSQININNAAVQINLQNETFANETPDKSNFILMHVPAGISISQVVCNNEHEAVLTLLYDSTDFNSDSLDFYVKVAASEITSGVAISTGTLPVYHVEANLSAASQLTGSNLNNAQLTLNLVNVSFVDLTENVTNFTLKNAPTGLSISSVVINSTTQATITLAYSGTLSSDVAALGVAVAGAELNGGVGINTSTLSILQTGVTITPSVALAESNLGTSTIGVVLSGLAFVADNSLLASNFVLNNAPSGLSITTVDYTSATQATIHLAFDGTDFDSDITDFSVTVKSAELVDASDITSNAVSIVATVETNSANLSYNGSLTESRLSGAVLTLDLVNETFKDNTLDIANFSLIGVPTGTTISDISYQNTTQALITLGYSGDDFTNDYTNFHVNINGAELTGATNVSTNSLSIYGVDAQIESTPAVLTTQNIDAATVTITLVNDTLVDLTPDVTAYTLNNVPAGVSVESVTATSSTTIAVALAYSGSGISSDISNFSVSIAASELTGNKVLTTNELPVLCVTATLSLSGTLKESNLDGAELSLDLTHDTFADNVIDPANITLLSAPAGLEISALTNITSTHATIVLAYDGTDISADYSDFAIDIAATELSSAVSLTSNVLSIVHTEAVIAASGLTETNLNDAEITLTLTNLNFADAALAASNFILNNAPYGTSVDSVKYTSAGEAVLYIGFDGTDFDVDVTNMTVTVQSIELANSGSITSNAISITAVQESNSALLSYSGTLTEAYLNGASLTISLVGETFTDNTLDVANFTAVGGPATVTVNDVSYINDTAATVKLAYSGGDFSTNYNNLRVVIAASELTGGAGMSTNSISVVAVGANLTSSPSPLNENDLNSATLTIELVNATFANSLPDANNFILNNAPTGLSVDGVTLNDATHVTLSLSFNQTNFDVDVTNFSVTVLAAEVNGGIDVTTGQITILADPTGADIIPAGLISIYSYKNKVYVKTENTNLDGSDLFVYDILGRLIIKQAMTESSLNVVEVNGNSGYYIVKLIEKQNVKTQKVFIKAE